MDLFDECREALSADFNVVEGQELQEVLNVLYTYPFIKGSIKWPNMKNYDYEDINVLLRSNFIKNYDVFVLADSQDVPVFKSNLKLIGENIYDVTALCPKLFIFNEEFLIQPLFPTEMFRMGINPTFCRSRIAD